MCGEALFSDIPSADANSPPISERNDSELTVWLSFSATRQESRFGHTEIWANPPYLLAILGCVTSNRQPITLADSEREILIPEPLNGLYGRGVPRGAFAATSAAAHLLPVN